MATRASRFRMADLSKAIKGAAKAGMPIERIRAVIDKDGRIIIETRPDSEPVDTATADEVPYL